MKILILVIGCQLPPWDVMPETSQGTWDSVEVENVETIYYFGNPVKENTGKFIYFPVDESYNTMGHKMMLAFEWALDNKEFDYVARVNSSCYVDKKELVKYVAKFTKENVFAGLRVTASDKHPEWLWGGGNYVISKDVIKKIFDNRYYLDETIMEDLALSFLVTKLGVPFTDGMACSIDKLENGWRLTGYGAASFEFSDFADVNKSGQSFYRCKQDYDRSKDEFVMNELYKVLK